MPPSTTPVSDWFRINAISLIIAITTLVSTYAVYGYRLSVIEARQDRQGTAITQIQSGDLATAVAIAQIQKDIEYIKLLLERAYPPVK